MHASCGNFAVLVPELVVFNLACCVIIAVFGCSDCSCFEQIRFPVSSELGVSLPQ